MGTLTVRTGGRAIAQLRALQARLGNITPALKAWAQYKELAVREQFDSQTAPDGTPWAPLKESTLKEKGRTGRKRGKSLNKILQDTGALRDTITTAVTADGVEIGSNLRVGSYSLLAIQQEGTDKIPARPVLGITDADQRELDAIVTDYLGG